MSRSVALEFNPMKGRLGSSSDDEDCNFEIRLAQMNSDDEEIGREPGSVAGPVGALDCTETVQGGCAIQSNASGESSKMKSKYDALVIDEEKNNDLSKNRSATGVPTAPEVTVEVPLQPRYISVASMPSLVKPFSTHYASTERSVMRSPNGGTPSKVGMACKIDAARQKIRQNHGGRVSLSSTAASPPLIRRNSSSNVKTLPNSCMPPVPCTSPEASNNQCIFQSSSVDSPGRCERTPIHIRTVEPIPSKRVLLPDPPTHIESITPSRDPAHGMSANLIPYLKSPFESLQRQTVRMRTDGMDRGKKGEPAVADTARAVLRLHTQPIPDIAVKETRRVADARSQQDDPNQYLPSFLQHAISTKAHSNSNGQHPGLENQDPLEKLSVLIQALRNIHETVEHRGAIHADFMNNMRQNEAHIMKEMMKTHQLIKYGRKRTFNDFCSRGTKENNGEMLSKRRFGEGRRL